MIAVTLIFLAFLISALGMPPINVIANVRGKKYDVSAETVAEFSSEIETLTGIEASQQNVLYKGKVLSQTDKLEEVGIVAGEVLNVVKGRKIQPKPVEEVAAASTATGGANSAFGGPAGGETDPAALEEALKNADPEQVKKAMAAMDNLLDSNFMEEFFDDEEKMEASRLQLLQNVDKYENMMPGFKQQAQEIASDPVKWKEAMLRTKEQMLKLKQQREAFRSAVAKQQSSAVTPPTNPANTGVSDAPKSE